MLKRDANFSGVLNSSSWLLLQPRPLTSSFCPPSVLPPLDPHLETAGWSAQAWTEVLGFKETSLARRRQSEYKPGRCVVHSRLTLAQANASWLNQAWFEPSEWCFVLLRTAAASMSRTRMQLVVPDGGGASRGRRPQAVSASITSHVTRPSGDTASSPSPGLLAAASAFAGRQS